VPKASCPGRAISDWMRCAFFSTTTSEETCNEPLGI
jgi:hypothetical protein